MFEKFHDALNANDGVFDKDFSKVTFFANQMGILRVDLDKINLNNYNNFQEGNPETIVFMLKVWLGITNLKNAKNFKKI